MLIPIHHAVRWVLFGACAAATLWPRVSPSFGLALGLVFALLLGSPLEDRTSRWASQLMKVCIIGLGFGISFMAVIDTGTTGLLITGLAAASVVLTGVLLGVLMNVDATSARLISSGTAICGGSAIAALSPILRARPEAIAVALAIVFVLNAVALYLFPLLGRLLELSQEQFAIWSAIAIHDTASVVGAASTYGSDSLELATILKLARALWIIPLVVLFAWWVSRSNPAAEDVSERKTAIQWPWFIGLFVLASAARSLWPDGEPLFTALSQGARQLLVLTLFLVGASLTVSALKAVGLRPLLHGVLLWLLTSGLTLLFVLRLDRPLLTA